MKELFMCERCGFIYEDRETAMKCEEFCRRNKACNSDYLKKALGRMYGSTKTK